MDLSQPTTDVQAALNGDFSAARRAYERERMPPADARRDALSRLEHLLTENTSAIEAAISADFGNRSAHETRLLEIFPALAAVRDAKKHVKSWMKTRRSWASM